MKTPFDKIFVLNVLTNRERRDWIKSEFDKVGLEFEFIHSADYSNILYDKFGKHILWPITLQPTRSYKELAKDFGCAITHYTAVLQAYELGYENVLIIEDDICFTKNIELIEKSINSIPEDADWVTWDPRNALIPIHNMYKERLNSCPEDQMFLEVIEGQWIIGGMMYGLMNREVMKKYLDAQRNLGFNMSDQVIGIWKQHDRSVKRYYSSKCICTDMGNLNADFDIMFAWYKNLYKVANPDKITKDMFFMPEDMNEAWTRWDPESYDKRHENLI